MSNLLTLDREDGIKLLKSFGLSLAGAALVWATEIIPGVDWGDKWWGPMLGAFAPFLVNAARKWLASSCT